MLVDSYCIPNGPVSLNSIYYIRRPVEKIIYQEVCKEGCLIRIKASQQMGKTSLIFRLIEQTKKNNYKTVYIDLQLADLDIFTSLDKFLHWFCAVTCQQLDLTANLNNYWDNDINCKINCTIYFQEYLLSNIKKPVVLIINELNRIFEYPAIAQNFLGLLRSWHEEAKHNYLFKDLRLILVYSTEIYITLNTYESPLNVGLAIKLLEFDLEEIKELAARYGLDWCTTQSNQAKELKSLVGGHPYLVQLALRELARYPSENPQDIFKNAIKLDEIYATHLQRLLTTLQDYPELAVAFQKLIEYGDSVQLDNKIAYKLESIGLIKIEGNCCRVFCELYRQFFAQQDFDRIFSQKQTYTHTPLDTQIHLIDNTTQIHNKRYLDAFLDYWWRKSTAEKTPLSIVLFDVDNFRIYNAIYGQEAGDICLWQVANVVRNTVDYNKENVLVARYKDDAFTIILPNTSAVKAVKIANNIREQVKNLAIKHVITTNGTLEFPIVTISTGVASVIPDMDVSPNALIDAAVKALNESKKFQGDFTFVSCNFRYGF
ncbi:diguanylate cyclase [Rivularia sp. IAM M-261]|nr:diguanylate cyclase [Calothrix sp. PCC 7716]GJD16489.1 diguanylate cyclase [Rivularia sp. IAM M-261]